MVARMMVVGVVVLTALWQRKFVSPATHSTGLSLRTDQHGNDPVWERMVLGRQRSNTSNPVQLSPPSLLPATPEKDVDKATANAVRAAVQVLRVDHLFSCHLSIFSELHPVASAATDFLLHHHLPQHGRKMFGLDEAVLGRESTWQESVCDVYVVAVVGGGNLIRLATHTRTDTHHPTTLWNYHAHYLVLLLGTELEPKEVAELYNLAKTEKVLMLQSSGERVQLWTHRLYSPGAPPRLQGSWRGGDFHRGQIFFPSKVGDLRGVVLRVATFNHPPSVVYVQDDDHKVTARLGVDMQIVNTLAEALDFETEFTEVSHDELWGYELPNGTWVGLVGKVTNELVDIGACNVFLEIHRWQLVDYSVPYNFEHGCFVAPSPKPLMNWRSPALPFTWDTWTTIGMLLVVGGVLLRVVELLSINPEAQEFSGVSYAYLYMLGSLSGQPLSLAPHHQPMRVYVGLVWVTGLILATAYSANLVAFLSVTQMSRPVDSMQQLSDSGLRLGGHAFWATQFAASIDPIVRSFVDRLETDIALNQLFDRVEAGQFALIENEQYLEVTVGAKYTRGGRASIRIVPECLLTYSIGLAFQKNSPLKAYLDPVILHLVESGLVLRWRREVLNYFTSLYASARTSSGTQRNQRSRPLSLNQLQGVFYVLVLGCLTAFILFTLEMLLSPSRPTIQH